ncbi:hypothetical protein X942_5263 [Burkholderia pseudomallei MSHR5596]|nr:hypothetical protein X942_5263 [Burkholderia pseudomallei MSHR5596]
MPRTVLLCQFRNIVKRIHPSKNTILMQILFWNQKRRIQISNRPLLIGSLCILQFGIRYPRPRNTSQPWNFD